MALKFEGGKMCMHTVSQAQGSILKNKNKLSIPNIIARDVQILLFLFHNTIVLLQHLHIDKVKFKSYI